MIPLIPLDTLSQYRSRDPIPFSCENCGDVFHRSKNIVCRAVKRTKSISCCSVKCAFAKKTADSVVIKDCPRCHKSFSRRKSDATTYCSQKCANVNGSSGSRTDQTKKKISQALKRRWSGRPDTHSTTLITHVICPICRKGFYHPHNRRRKFCGKTCYTKFFSDKCKATEGMCKNNNRHAGWYESPIAGRVWLESTWEVKVAKVLAANQVEWSRPKEGFLGSTWTRRIPTVKSRTPTR